MSKKSHLLVNANILGINSSILCVIEYIDDHILPEQVYFIASYDEFTEELVTDFSLFPNLSNNQYTSIDPFDKFIEIDSVMSTLNYDSIESTKVEICGSDIAKLTNRLNNTDVDYLDVELEHLLEFIKHEFYIDLPQELSLRKNIKANFFAKPLLENLLSKRQEYLNQKDQ